MVHFSATLRIEYEVSLGQMTRMLFLKNKEELSLFEQIVFVI